MSNVGLITEYNPFHNGHLHHLQESRHLTGAEASVAVMSGPFLQRGEPALVDKWTRTEMALAAGVDLVLELPVAFACNSAPHFARGAIQVLEATGVVESLCFGSEAGNLEALQQVAGLICQQRAAIEAETARLLRSGISFPVARAEVLAKLAPDLDPDLLAAPNNILGLEYLVSLAELSSQIRPFTLPRKGAGYHSSAAEGCIASATGIRRRLEEGKPVAHLMPEPCAAILQRALAGGRGYHPERLFCALQTMLLQEAPTLEGLCQVEAGLARRLGKAALKALDYADLVQRVKSRQWTLTRIQRILTYVLLQVGAEQMRGFLDSGPLYLRLLGSSARGEKVLARSRKRRTLPLVTDPSRAQATLRRFYAADDLLRERAEAMLVLDLRATRLYGLLQVTRPGDHANQDFFQPVRRR